MILTPSNYHSLEANQKYMSVSQFKDFDSCEAAALAKVNGEYEEEDKACLKVSSYVHASIEGPEALEYFKLNNPEIYSSRGSSKGELKAEYRHADVMVKSLFEDELCISMLQGEKEVIVTAELFGVVWKAKIDVLSVEQGRISDLKAVKSIRDRFYNPDIGRYESFVEHYKYTTQMAVYAELERLSKRRFERLEPFIVAVSKEEIPDKEIICFDDEVLDQELQRVSNKLPRIIAVKEGIEEPMRCEKCKYCRKTRKLKGFTHYSNLLEVV